MTHAYKNETTFLCELYHTQFLTVFLRAIFKNMYNMYNKNVYKTHVKIIILPHYKNDC